MAERTLNITGFEALPWTGELRKTNQPLPYGLTFIAATWRLPPTKNEPKTRYFWSAGVLHGPALDLDDGRAKADASLREQGAILL